MKFLSRLFANRRRDLEEELQSHLSMAIEDRRNRGETPDGARESALREFGNVPLIQDVAAAMSGRLWVERLGRDILYALRQLRKSPGFTITAILTLALAIGANTAVFTIVHAILLRQLPFRDPSRVLSVDISAGNGLDYDLRAKSDSTSFNQGVRSFRTIESAAAYSTSGVNMDAGSGISQRLQATETSAQFLDTLGVTPQMGRGFTSNDDTPGKDQVVMISDRLWRGKF